MLLTVDQKDTIVKRVLEAAGAMVEHQPPMQLLGPQLDCTRLARPGSDSWVYKSIGLG